jgi:hypothetical protein
VDVEDTDHDHFRPEDPDDLIMEVRFVPMAEAIDLVLAAGRHPGSQSTADYLRRPRAAEPVIWLWDLRRSAEPLGRIPAGPL